MSKLLLFSLLLVSILMPFCSATATDTPLVSDRVEVKTTPEAVTNPYNFDQKQIENSSNHDDYCLNIHAFIFKTEDDRVPKLVGETTCMRASGTKTKKINRFIQPKLVPATGGNAF
jgi:hypothetical protein